MELLRIVAMVFILILHFFTKTISIVDVNPYIYQSLVIANICGVNLYIMISGYFGIKGSIRSLGKLYGIIVFFSMFSFCVGALFFDIQISLIQLIKSVLWPFSFHYWFLSCYLGLFALAPLINKGLNLLSKEELRRIIVILTIISVYSCWLGRNNLIGMNGYSLFHFIYLYIVGFFLRRDKIFDMIQFRICFFLGIVFVLLNIILTYIADFYFAEFENIYWQKAAIAYNNPLIILASISIFMCFAKFKMGNKVWINSLASSSLGCYLLQEGSISVQIYKIQGEFALSHTLFEVLLMYSIIFILYWVVSYVLSRIYLFIILRFI